MLTSVGVAPGIAALRILNKIGLTSLPGYVGACGRLVFTSGGLLKLNELLNREWEQRLELARQVLRLIENLLSVEEWLLVAFGLNMDSFSVTRTGQVVLSNLDTLTPIDKDILLGLPQEERDVCNSQCFSDFEKEVMMVTPRGQPGKGCGSALLYSDMMYADVCREVISRLLYSAPEEVEILLRECIEEEGKGGRWQAIDDLNDYLEGNYESTTSELETTEESEYAREYEQKTQTSNKEESTEDYREEEDTEESYSEEENNLTREKY